MSVEVGGQVQHFAALFNAIGRRVGPAAREVEADGAARPDDLVFEHAAARGGRGKLGFVGNHFAEPGESGGFEALPVGRLAMPQHCGAEHPVVHQPQGIVVLPELELGQAVTACGKGACGSFEVEPEEDAAAEVLQHGEQAALPQPGALLVEPAQVDPLRQFLSGEPGQAAPFLGQVVACCGRGREQPLHEGWRNLPGRENGKEWAGLDIRLGVKAALLDHEPASLEPPARRLPQPLRGVVLQGAVERVPEAVSADAELVLADWHEVEAHARVEAQGPVVLGHAGQHMFRGKLPRGGHDTILDPQAVIGLPAQRGVEAGVLSHLVRLLAGGGPAGGGLVQHQVLQSGHRADHLLAGAEVIELRLWQRHHGAGEAAHHWVGECRRAAQGKAELGVKLIAFRAGGAEAAAIPAAALHEH